MTNSPATDRDRALLRATSTRRALALAIVTLMLLMPTAALAQDDAPEGEGVVSGTVFYDIDNDGRQDADEPGVPGVVVRVGSVIVSAPTDADGQWEFDGLTGVASITVQTGWLRSQCDSLDCEIGPGPDNDFPVENQRIKLTDIDLDEGGEFNLGVLPAWGVAYPIPDEPTSNPYDVATRITKIGGCVEGDPNICNPGDVVDGQIEFHNQGTEPIESVTFAVHRPRDTTWFSEPFLPEGYNPEGHSIDNLGFDEATNSGIYRVHGPIAPGAMAFLFVQVFVTDEGPATPEPIPTTNPFDRALQVRVLDMDAGGPDADSTFCFGAVPARCDQSTGPHSKLNRVDDSDGMGWNVGGVSYRSDFDLALTVRASTAEASVGEPVDLAVEIINQGSGDSDVANITVVVDLPDNVSFDAENSPGWSEGALGIVDTRVPGPLATGASTVLPLRVVATEASICDAPARVFAEIATFGNAEDTQVGGQLPLPDQDPAREGQQIDVDSTPDRNPNNDGQIVDDFVDGNADAEPADEDDSDIATMAILDAQSCVAAAGSGLPTNIIGIVLMGLAGVLGLVIAGAKIRDRRGNTNG